MPTAAPAIKLAPYVGLTLYWAVNWILKVSWVVFTAEPVVGSPARRRGSWVHGNVANCFLSLSPGKQKIFKSVVLVALISTIIFSGTCYGLKGTL